MEIPHITSSSCLQRRLASASCCCKTQTSRGCVRFSPNNRLSLRQLWALVCPQLWTAESHALSSLRAQTLSLSDSDGLPTIRLITMMMMTTIVKYHHSQHHRYYYYYQAELYVRCVLLVVNVVGCFNLPKVRCY